MKTHDRSLAVQFLILLGIGLVLLGSSGTFGVIKLSSILDTYDSYLATQVANEREILRIEIDFKVQVQEWKDVLLRGHAPASLEKYWGQFETLERGINERVEKLLPALQDPEIRNIMQDFLVTHRAMGEKYREGLKHYKEAGFDSIAGDKVVKGIDRAPAEQLTKAAERLSGNLSTRTRSLSEASHSTLLLTVLLCLGSGLIYVVLGGLLLQRNIIKPTQEISANLGRFANGDFTPIELKAYSGELEDLACSTKDVQRHLGSIIHDVRDTADHLSRAATDLKSVNQTTHNDLQQQMNDIQQVSSIMDKMAVVVSQVTENTRAAATATDAANAAAQQGRTEVAKNIKEINGLAQDVENASRVVQELESDVSGIAKVLDVIRGIAEQTNLLALNAAIEAARAGEQGRGFAVVADEVRTLAGRTQESTQEIQEMIEKLESGSSKAVHAMQNSRQQAERSVEQSASTGTSLDTIAQAVNAINEMNQQIANSAREQAMVTDEIHHSMVKINNLSRHTSEGARQMSEAGDTVANLAENMDRLVHRFKI